MEESIASRRESPRAKDGVYRILFIGNSYTYYNDMPSIFASVCRENGLRVNAESVTSGGYYLSQFLDPCDEYGAQAAKKLSGTNYDYVVMQEQSLLPASDPEEFLKSAAALAKKVRENGAIPVFYETWGRRDGHETLVEEGWTHEQMQDRLRAAYGSAAEASGGILVCAGDRMSEAYRAGEDVFDADGSHPSETGSRVIAGEFYNVLFA